MSTLMCLEDLVEGTVVDQVGLIDWEEGTMPNLLSRNSRTKTRMRSGILIAETTNLRRRYVHRDLVGEEFELTMLGLASLNRYCL